VLLSKKSSRRFVNGTVGEGEDVCKAARILSHTAVTLDVYKNNQGKFFPVRIFNYRPLDEVIGAKFPSGEH
jgi:hypothetical protein